LLVYSNLRNLDSLTNKIVREMPILYDITKDSFYLEGKEKGREEGIEKGIEEKGNAVRKMLEKGFEVKLICEILSVTPKYVKQIQEEVRGEK
jgi:predicted transposase/invertase (TIGR01784 family)